MFFLFRVTHTQILKVGLYCIVLHSAATWFESLANTITLTAIKTIFMGAPVAYGFGVLTM